MAVLVVATTLPYALFGVLCTAIRPSGAPADKREVEPAVSILLPTYNEERIVEKKLDDALELDYPMEKVEHVVVDSSDDATRDIIRGYFADLDAPDLTLIEEDERRGLSPALNEPTRPPSTRWSSRRPATPTSRTTSSVRPL